MSHARREVKIQNNLGLHARPATKFVQLASKFRCKVTVRKDSQTVNGKSVMGMMMLAAAKGTKIVIEAIYGLGEMLVGGRATPDHYLVGKKNLAIIL